MHQCNYCNQKYTRNYNLKVHIEKMHSEDNTNNMNDLAVPALAPTTPPSPATSPIKKSMKNKTFRNNHNYLRKIKMMLTNSIF